MRAPTHAVDKAFTTTVSTSGRSSNGFSCPCGRLPLALAFSFLFFTAILTPTAKAADSILPQSAAMPAATENTPALTVSNVTETSATLTIVNHSTAWWYEGNQAGATCTSVSAGTSTADLSDLTGGTSYTYKAYDKTGCHAADEIASETFTTISLTVSNVTETSATLTIVNHSTAWWYEGNQAGATCTSVSAGTGTADLSGLTGGTSYTYKAYDKTGCHAADEIATSETFTTVSLTVSNVRETRVILTLDHYHAGEWYVKKIEPPGIPCLRVQGHGMDMGGLYKGTDYTIGAYRTSGCTPASKIADVQFTTPGTRGPPGKAPKPAIRLPSLPDPAGGKLLLFWYDSINDNGGSRITGYDIRYGVKDSNNYSDVKLEKFTFLVSVKLTGLTNDAEYEVMIRAINEKNGAGPWSDPATGTPSRRPDQPLTVANVTPTTATLSLANSTGDWWHERDNDSSTCSKVESGTKTVDVSGLSPGTTYTFRAFNHWTCIDGLFEVAWVRFTTPNESPPVADLVPTFGNQESISQFMIPNQMCIKNQAIKPLVLPAATGGNPPLTYTLTQERYESNLRRVAATRDSGPLSHAPALPLGLTFDPVTRVLAGTPTETQDETRYVYTATDVDGDSATVRFTIKVMEDVMPTFGDQTIRARTYMQDQAIAALPLPQATSGNPPLTYTLTPALPAGLTFDPMTRTLAGTPAEPQNATRYTYTATDVDGDPATLTFTIKVMLSVAEKKRLEAGLAAQGRALLSGATGVLGERFRSPGPSLRDGLAACAGPQPDETRGKSGEGSQPADCTTGLLTTVAQAVLAMSGTGGSADSLALADADETRPRGPRAVDVGTQPAWDWESLVWGRSFALPLKKPGSPGNAWTLWGAGDIQGFRGDPVQAGQGRYDGQVRSLYLGVDTQWHEQWLAGAALARSWGETNYAAGAGGSKGQLETTLTSIYPYVRGAFESGLEVWALGGYGRGEAELSRPDQAEAATSDLSLAMGATGVRQPMIEFGGAQWAVVGGAGYLSLATEEWDSLVSDLDVAVQRARLAVEATWATGGLAPYVQVGGRYDGGDGQTGAGLETVAGVRYTSERVEFEARGRWLAAHAAEGYEEYGGLARLAVKPRADGTGWQMDVAPRWGAAQGAGLLGGGEALLGGGAVPGMGVNRLPSATTRVLSVESELGYGFGVLDGYGVLTPYGGFALTGEETRRYRVGGRLGVARWLNVSLEGSRQEGTGPQPANQGVQVKLEGRF